MGGFLAGVGLTVLGFIALNALNPNLAWGPAPGVLITAAVGAVLVGAMILVAR